MRHSRKAWVQVAWGHGAVPSCLLLSPGVIIAGG